MGEQGYSALLYYRGLNNYRYYCVGRAPRGSAVLQKKKKILLWGLEYNIPPSPIRIIKAPTLRLHLLVWQGGKGLQGLGGSGYAIIEPFRPPMPLQPRRFTLQTQRVLGIVMGDTSPNHV